MGELKPLGSEKLKGQEKIKRILDITYYERDSKSKQNTCEYLTENDGFFYGIVKEKDGYYVKKGLNESSLDYIGGLFMKNKNRFSSYAEALKKLELIKKQSVLSEAKKYVLKTKSSDLNPETEPTPETSLPNAPIEDAPIEDNNIDSGENFDSEFQDTSTDDAEIDNNTDDDFNKEDEDTSLKSIQKLTGKLGQKLRGFQDEIKSEDIKYVLNSIISAIDLEKLEEPDKEDVLSKFEDDEFDGETENNEVGDDTEDMDMSEMEDLVKMKFDFNEIEDENKFSTKTVGKSIKSLPIVSVDDDYWFD